MGDDRKNKLTRTVDPASDGLEVLKWRGESLAELDIFDGDLLFIDGNFEMRELPFVAFCMIEIIAIEERRVKMVEFWSCGMVYLTPVSHIYERSIFHISEIRIVGVVRSWF